MSNAVGGMLDGLGEGTLEFLEGLGLLLHIGVMLVFLIEVVHSKHLHIMAAPINVLFKRQPIALGAAKPLMAAGKPITLDDIDEIDEDTTFGVGSIEDFSWKGMLDFATCTECGRCQSQCPAWNTEKPLSPKLLIMALRDHAYAKGPYLLADEGKRESLGADVLAEAERPLVGATEGDPSHPSGGAVIDDDVLWSCVTCGACVQQCPVDIEHVDHIVDMRRYQVLVESSFPAELNGLFKGMENRGNPWNMAANARMDWAKDLDFDVPVVGEDLESLESVDWLFWVGCAGAYEDRAKKTTQAVAELLTMAGVSFGVLGTGETCTGDSARRAGNEFVFQGLAQQNVETFKEFKVKKAVTTCAHCFNTLKNEYREFGIELEVVHHTQLLNQLVREGKLTPIADGAGAATRSITYHDPCYLGRHNQVYAPPRELLAVLPGAEYVEMPRNSERSFCCGAGGARMWMEEKIGSRINENRTNEAVATGADQIAVGCPFCRVMLSDGLTTAKAEGTARDDVEVLDVAQMLLASVKGQPAVTLTPARPCRPAAAPAAPGRGVTPAPRSHSRRPRSQWRRRVRRPPAARCSTYRPRPSRQQPPRPPQAARCSTYRPRSRPPRPRPRHRRPRSTRADRCSTSLHRPRHPLHLLTCGTGGEPGRPAAPAVPSGRARCSTSPPRRRRTGAEPPRRPPHPSSTPRRPQHRPRPSPPARCSTSPAPAASPPTDGQPADVLASVDDHPAAEAADGRRRSPETILDADDPEPEAGRRGRRRWPRGAPSRRPPYPSKKPEPGEAHQPRTDADIHNAGSLFDL